MASAIRPLPQDVVDSIRSGITVPSFEQCVEELVMNSIDAGSTSIRVQIDIPKYRIQVTDNGCGIPWQDFDLLASRYATSKCYRLPDLGNLKFYGFRGEGLASMQNVGILDIKSRTKGTSTTYAKVLQHSKVTYVGPATKSLQQHGTVVTVHDLYGKMPVRRKMLSSSGLTLEQVRWRMESLALIHPNISFAVGNDSSGTKLLQTRGGCSSYKLTFQEMFGSSLPMHEVPNIGHTYLTVVGYVSIAGHNSAAHQHLYINGRPLRKTPLHKLIANTFLSSSSLGQRTKEKRRAAVADLTCAKRPNKYPAYILNIKCPYDKYDVCFLPDKSLVEFQDWDDANKFLSDTLMEFLRRHHLLLGLEVTVNSTTELKGLREESERSQLLTFQYKGAERNGTITSRRVLRSHTKPPKVLRAPAQPRNVQRQRSGRSESLRSTFVGESAVQPNQNSKEANRQTSEASVIDAGPSKNVRTVESIEANAKSLNKKRKFTAWKKCAAEEDGKLYSKHPRRGVTTIGESLLEDQTEKERPEFSEATATKTRQAIPKAAKEAEDAPSVVKMLNSWKEKVIDNERDGANQHQDLAFQSATATTQIVLSKDMLKDLRVLGQVDTKFIACVLASQGREVVTLVDQHAAHERVRLERLQKGIYEKDNSEGGQPSVESVLLHPPLQISLSGAECHLVRRFNDKLLLWGVECALSGDEDNTQQQSYPVVVRRVPRVLISGSHRQDWETSFERFGAVPSRVIKDLIKEQLEVLSATSGGGGALVIPRCITQVLNSRACHGAIKFGDRLSLSACQNLMSNLSKCELPFQCAHGRPAFAPILEI